MSTKALPIPTDPAVALAAIRLVSRGEGSWDKIDELADKAGNATKKDKATKTAVEAVNKVRSKKDIKPKATRSRVESAPAPVQQPDRESIALDNARFDAYLRAYLRLSTGQISELSTDDMIDVAFISLVKARNFDEWKAVRFGQA